MTAGIVTSLQKATMTSKCSGLVEPLINGDGQVVIPGTLFVAGCGDTLDDLGKCQNLHAKENVEQHCGAEYHANTACVMNTLYNYVALRRMCKREYTAWAKCMNECAAAEMGPEEADARCNVYRTPLDKCSLDISMPAAQVAMERKMNPKDIPEQK